MLTRQHNQRRLDTRRMPNPNNTLRCCQLLADIASHRDIRHMYLHRKTAWLHRTRTGCYLDTLRIPYFRRHRYRNHYLQGIHNNALQHRYPLRHSHPIAALPDNCYRRRSRPRHNAHRLGSQQPYRCFPTDTPRVCNSYPTRSGGCSVRFHNQVRRRTHNSHCRSRADSQHTDRSFDNKNCPIEPNPSTIIKYSCPGLPQIRQPTDRRPRKYGRVVASNFGICIATKLHEQTERCRGRALCRQTHGAILPGTKLKTPFTDATITATATTTPTAHRGWFLR